MGAGVGVGSGVGAGAGVGAGVGAGAGVGVAVGVVTTVADAPATDVAAVSVDGLSEEPQPVKKTAVVRANTAVARDFRDKFI